MITAMLVDKVCAQAYMGESPGAMQRKTYVCLYTSVGQNEMPKDLQSELGSIQ